jgi:hypothetical protein
VEGPWPTDGQDPRSKEAPVGFDYVHSVVDDHSRVAYSEILSDEKGATCAAFLRRAAEYFNAHGITQIERIMTDNAYAYRDSLREIVATLRIRGRPGRSQPRESSPAAPVEQTLRPTRARLCKRRFGMCRSGGLLGVVA